MDWHGDRNKYLNAKLKIFQLQKRTHFAIINNQFKNLFLKKKFSSKLIIPKYKNYKKIKNKIKNNYLTSKINDENMSFVYTLSRLLKIKESLFVNAMKTFKGMPHRFEHFLEKKIYLL